MKTFTQDEINDFESFDSFLKERDNLAQIENSFATMVHALHTVKLEYKQALDNKASFLSLLDIKLRLDNIKDLYETEVSILTKAA